MLTTLLFALEIKFVYFMLTTLLFALEIKFVLKVMRGEFNGFSIMKQIEKPSLCSVLL